MHFQDLVAANPPGHKYSLQDSLKSFFAKTTVKKQECDEKAIYLVGGETVTPVAIQGKCSYTLFADPHGITLFSFGPAILRLMSKHNSRQGNPRVACATHPGFR